MLDSQVLAFTVVAALLTLSPGADTMLVVRNVLRGGRREGVVTTFGICSGLFVHATLSAVGLSVILTRSAATYQAVKIAGACYLAWLGLQSLGRAFRGVKTPAAFADLPRGRPARQAFVEGFFTNVLNPKVAVFYLSFLPQFISPGDPVLAKSLLLASIHYGLGIVWLVFLSATLDRARAFVLRGAVRRWLDGICGVVLLGLGARLALEKR